ncbi:hypothetical protein ABIE49_006541 [Bradyrhizobium sp. OAE829]
MDNVGPSPDEKSIEPNVPKPRTATTSSIRFVCKDFMATSIGGLNPVGVSLWMQQVPGLIWINQSGEQ